MINDEKEVVVSKSDSQRKMVRVGREGEWFRIEGNDEILMWRHVCITIPLTLTTSLVVNIVGENLTKGTKLHILKKKLGLN